MDKNGTNNNGNSLTKSPENVNAAYRRLVLDAPSLLPRCEMPVARMLFEEWFAEQKARKDLKVVTHE
jgi:hypothetical protein